MAIKYDVKLTDTQYTEKRYKTLRYLECVGGKVDLSPYTDDSNGGYATIGAGFKIDSNWDEILTALGFDILKDAIAAEKLYISQIEELVGYDKKFTTSEMTTLVTDINKIMQKRAEDPNVTNAIEGENKRTEFKFKDEPEVKATFQPIAKRREDILDAWLAEKELTIPKSDERIALLSLVYNNIVGFKDKAQTIVKSPNLLDALKAGNRAEAWYEIRYYSNKNALSETPPDSAPGIAKRRYYR